jgi:hypothetical protein
MAHRPEEPSALPWQREYGLVWPSPRARRRLADAHLIAALAVAPPAWLLLGAMVGEHMYRPAGASAWLTFVLLQPLVEEVTFRGVLQGLLLRGPLRRRCGPLTWANLGTTAAFAAWHVGTQPLGWVLAVAIPSLVFGHLRERFGSVWPAVIVHIVYNAGFGATAWWMQR